MAQSVSVYQFGPFALDVKDRVLTREGRRLPLTPKDFQTLLFLLENAGRLIEKEEFLSRIWPGILVEENSLAREISRLRKLLEDESGSPRYIETQSRLGYRFIAQVEEIQAEESPGPAAPPPAGRRHLAIVFASWQGPETGGAGLDRWLELLSEHKYKAQCASEQYGSLGQGSTGSDDVFLFETPESGIRFALALLAGLGAEQGGSPAVGLRLSCHYGECLRLSNVRDWWGRGLSVAQSLTRLVPPHRLWVTESVLDQTRGADYRIREVGLRDLEADHVPRRMIYEVVSRPESGDPEESLSAEQWFLKGVALNGSGRENSQEEISCYIHALQLKPDYPEVHNNLGVVLKWRGRTQEAAAHYRQALRLRPDYPAAHYNYALWLESEKRINGAIIHFRETLRLCPDHVNAHHSYANLLRARGHAEEAESHYREALRLRPLSAELHNNLAILLEDRGNPGAAETLYRRALELQPVYLEAHYNYALLLERAGNSKAAEHHYREALRLKPECAEALNNLAVLLHTRGDLEDAEVHYRQVLSLRPADPEAHYNYGLLLRSRGLLSQAQQHLRTACELAPEETASHFQAEFPDPPSE